MENKIRVLVVDDDFTVLRSLSAFLEDEGFTVFSSTGAQEAIKTISDTLPDVVVVDLRLRGVSGELLVTRSHATRPSTKYLVHTGSIGYRLSPELIKIGMTQEDVLYKPVSALNIISHAIRRLAGRS
jgi:DNA-binding NtrC family response regulator